MNFISNWAIDPSLAILIVSQAYTDCDDSVFATLTLSGDLSDLSK
jgi:hypothetical protein